MTSDPVRVLIADDDALLCSALTFALHACDPGIEVVATAENGRRAIEETIAHRPDVVLMDIAMPVMDGLTATREIRGLPSPPEVVIVTTFDADDEAVRAAHAGASGFLLKSEAPAVLASSVRSVAAGDGALSRRTARQLLRHVAADPHEAERREARDLVATLSAREREVAALVAEGLSNAEISERLHLSESTVKTHLGAAQAKLGAANRVVVAVVMTRAAS